MVNDFVKYHSINFTNLIQSFQLRSGQPRFRVAFRIFEIEIILGALLAEFGSGNIHPDLDGLGVTSFFHGQLDQFERLLVFQNIRSEPTCTY